MFTCLHIVQDEYNSIAYMLTYCTRGIQFYCLHAYILYRRNTILLFTCIHNVQEEYNSVVYMLTCLNIEKGEIIPFYCLHVYILYRGDTVLLFTCLPAVKRRCCPIVSCKLRRRSLGKPYLKKMKQLFKDILNILPKRLILEKENLLCL